MRHAKEYRRGAKGKAVIFFTALALIMIFSLIIPIRPVESKVEKRDLTPFPQFTVESLLDGKFFRGIDTWFSDTFPQRDTFFKINETVRSMYGAGTDVTIHGSIQEGDDIPDKPFTGE